MRLRQSTTLPARGHIPGSRLDMPPTAWPMSRKEIEKEYRRRGGRSRMTYADEKMVVQEMMRDRFDNEQRIAQAQARARAERDPRPSRREPSARAERKRRQRHRNAKQEDGKNAAPVPPSLRHGWETFLTTNMEIGWSENTNGSQVNAESSAQAVPRNCANPERCPIGVSSSWIEMMGQDETLRIELDPDDESEIELIPPSEADGVVQRPAFTKTASVAPYATSSQIFEQPDPLLSSWNCPGQPMDDPCASSSSLPSISCLAPKPPEADFVLPSSAEFPSASQLEKELADEEQLHAAKRDSKEESRIVPRCSSEILSSYLAADDSPASSSTEEWKPTPPSFLAMTYSRWRYSSSEPSE